MRRNAVVLALVLGLAPFGAKGADLVVWWNQGFYPQADEAVREIVAAFEQETGKQVELVQPTEDEIMKQAASALEAGAPPDFLFGARIETSAARWAYDDRLVDLGGVLGPVLDLFDADTIEVSTLLDGKTGRRGLYALPMGRISNHVHVWNSLLERAGFTSPTSRASGRRSGRSGAIACSRRYARRSATRTSGRSASRCRPQRPSTQNSSSRSSSGRTRHPG